jgi:hypothetical protein
MNHVLCTRCYLNYVNPAESTKSHPLQLSCCLLYVGLASNAEMQQATHTTCAPVRLVLRLHYTATPCDTCQPAPLCLHCPSSHLATHFLCWLQHAMLHSMQRTRQDHPPAQPRPVTPLFPCTCWLPWPSDEQRLPPNACTTNTSLTHAPRFRLCTCPHGTLLVCSTASHLTHAGVLNRLTPDTCWCAQPPHT